MGAEASAVAEDWGEPLLAGPDYNLHHTAAGQAVWAAGPGGALDRLAAGLRRYRHPAILRYVDYRSGRAGAFLTTEQVWPLQLDGQAGLAACLGLHQICQAVAFLHTVAGVSHNNLCLAAILTTESGSWRLAGLESAAAGTEASLARDIQALGLLVTQLLADSEELSAVEFRDYAKSQLILPDVSRLPSIESILEHKFFSQPLIQICTMLQRLPLQSADTKFQFFSSLPERLRQLPADVVARQLLPLLLSRYVFCEAAARQFLLPLLLVPRTGPHTTSLLPLPLYTSHLTPHLKLLFSVRERGVRLTLLEHWPRYAAHLDRETLQHSLLPALLLGVRDTDPLIVSRTLHCLADLVPILGPSSVTGTTSSRIFTDGSPSGGQSQDANKTEEEPTICRETAGWGDEENWDSWNGGEHEPDPHDVSQKTCAIENVVEVNSDVYKKSDIASNLEKIIKNVGDLDIMKMNSKILKTKTDKIEDVDFFTDMKPQIVKKSSSLDEFEKKLLKEQEENIYKSSQVNDINYNLIKLIETTFLRKGLRE